MRKAIALTIFQAFVSFSYSMAQPNCFIYQKDKNCYEACIEAERALQHPQGSKSSQQHLLNSIDLCPDFDYSYFEQSVPYAKRGLMHQWLGIINKAVELNPREYLGWRGWYHWLFMRNYEKAIADIDRLDSIMESDIGATGDGLYHLNIVKALCYKGIGDYNKAIELIENCINSKDYYKGSYDNLHLGVLYLEVKEPTKALVEFEKQVGVQ
jgi:tetratricopeptide (TPR) repeat protein